MDPEVPISCFIRNAGLKLKLETWHTRALGPLTETVDIHLLSLMRARPNAPKVRDPDHWSLTLRLILPLLNDVVARGLGRDRNRIGAGITISVLGKETRPRYSHRVVLAI